MDSASFQTLPFVKYHLERRYITMLSISWHIKLRKFNLLPHTHSHTCRKCYIPNLMQLAHTSDRVHFPDSSFLSRYDSNIHVPFTLPSFLPSSTTSLSFIMSRLLLFFSSIQRLTCWLAFFHFTPKHSNRVLFIYRVCRHWLFLRGVSL